MKRNCMGVILSLALSLSLLPVAHAAGSMELIPVESDKNLECAGAFSNGLAMVRDAVTDKYGYVNQEGKLVIPCIYRADFRSTFHEGLACVAQDDMWGCIDTNGNVVIPFGSADDSFSEGFAQMRGGYIDRTGTQAFPLPNAVTAYGGFHEGRAIVCGVGNKYGFVDQSGTLLVPCQYDVASDFSEGLAYVAADGKGMLIDLNGNKVADAGNYSVAEAFSDGLAVVCKAGIGKWTFIDHTGREIFPAMYEGCSSFNDGLALVETGTITESDFQFIDKTGKAVLSNLSNKYGHVVSFHDGLAWVRERGNGMGPAYRYGFIDTSGTEVIPLQYGWYDPYGFGGLNPYPFSEGAVLVETTVDGKNTLAVLKNPLGIGSVAPVSPTEEKQPTTPTASLAYATGYQISVNGTPVSFDAYALKDENGNDTNYLKLRDVAHILNGTSAQFEVGWDGRIAITAGKPYTDNGSEMTTPFSGNQEYQVNTSAVVINGNPATLDAILLTDSGSSGYTYFKLRDLGDALGFAVNWSTETGITIVTE